MRIVHAGELAESVINIGCGQAVACHGCDVPHIIVGVGEVLAVLGDALYERRGQGAVAFTRWKIKNSSLISTKKSERKESIRRKENAGQKLLTKNHFFKPYF